MDFLTNNLVKVTHLRRKLKVFIQLITDILISCFCFALSLLLASHSLSHILDPVIFIIMIASISTGVIAFASYGLYNSLVRFITDSVLIIVAKSVIIGSSVLALLIFVTDANIQLTIPFIYALVLFISIGGIRLLIKRIFLSPNQKIKKPTIIYGAGDAGRELLNTLSYNNKMLPVAFIDDNSTLHGLTIGGCRVYSNASFEKIKKEYGVKLVLLALPTISRQRRKKIIEMFQFYNVEIKSIPPLSKILTGQALVSELRSVTPEMLLGRDAISPDKNLMQRNILNRSVMITGAGGSIGSELTRQALMHSPSKLILFELSELALYQINNELMQIKEQTNNSTVIVPILGSIQDMSCLTDTIKTFGVTSIYHAAAYKHVPLVEDNIIEGIKNNVIGTLKVVQAAIELNVKNFTLISTDKAVRPTNIMGASKRIAELICQAHAKEKLDIKLDIVRFGNVLGSSGSVIPLFQKQIEAGGPVTVTHNKITRYFMTIPEAAELVIQASAMTSSGDVFVLDMGKPIKIVDLAKEMIKLSGFQHYFSDTPNQVQHKTRHIPISITGLRNGEKLYEELLIGNSPQPTEHPRIMKASEVSVNISDLTFHLTRLENACNTHNLETIFNILNELPLEFNHNSNTPPDIYSKNKP